MKEKKLLIVERSNASLNMQVEQVLNENNEHSDSIVLTGPFTTFGTKNRNGRIYESADFLPHVEALKEQIQNKRLLGELDHPHGFEISLGNVSHVVESLEYDPQQNAIIGKIRLLNTKAGKEAQALVRDGIPLNISSRAAGTVDESGHVRLQQLFTYDLVADPGFANAQLKRVNESYGFGDNADVDIYDLSEDVNTELDPKVEKTADAGAPQAEKNADALKDTGKEEKQYIQYADFQKYTEHLSDIISDLQSAVSNYKNELESVKNASAQPTQVFSADKIDNSLIADLVSKEVAKIQNAKDGAPVVGGAEPCNGEDCEDVRVKCEEMEEKYNNLTAYAKYLAETLNKSITHQDYITDETNKVISHNNYLVEKMNQMVEHQDYLAENLSKTIDYQNYVAEALDKSIGYQDYIAENLDGTIKYQNYMSEMLDKSIDYSNMLAEEQNKSVAHQDYLAEKMNQMVDHQDYLAEELGNKENRTAVNEKVETKVEKPVAEPVVENKENKPEEPAFDAKAYQTELNEKLANLLSTVRTQYAEAKAKEKEALEESKKNVDTTNFTLINYIPERLQERWSKLSDDRKKEILAESKMLVINNAASATYFWNTRDLREKQIEIQKIDESANVKPAQNTNVSDERLRTMTEIIKRNMRKY
jgi:hypothetical protein